MKRILIIAIFIMPLKSYPVLSAQDLSSDTFSWLEGKWKQLTERVDQTSYEEWRKISRDTLIGMNWTLNGIDTTFIEHLTLTKIDQTWYYEALITSASMPVRFTIEDLSDNGFIARNRLHDFPKKIHYSKINSSRFKATISDENRSIDFEFIKN